MDDTIHMEASTTVNTNMISLEGKSLEKEIDNSSGMFYIYKHLIKISFAIYKILKLHL